MPKGIPGSGPERPEYRLSWYGWAKVGPEFFKIMLDEIRQARGIADMRIKAAKPQAGRQIGYRIRAELVCCDIFGYVNEPGITEEEHKRRFREYEEQDGNHDLCYWGEASARIAETPEQWENDPHDWDWSAPLLHKRRERRKNGDQEAEAGS